MPRHLLTAITLTAITLSAATHQHNTPEETSSRDPGRDASTSDDQDRDTFTVHRVYYTPEIIPVIRVRRNFATVIQLPDNEDVMEVICGDGDWWQIARAKNLVYVKPSKDGAKTNLNIVGTSGTLYMFVLTEITPVDDKDQPTRANDVEAIHYGPADMKVIVQAGNTLQQRLNAGPSYVPRNELDAQNNAYQQQLADAEQRAARARNDAERAAAASRARANDAVDQFRSSYPSQLQLDYDVALHTAPFYVEGIVHDNRFTYIKLKAQEIPAIYEIKDGKPNLVQYDYAGNGTYIIRKIIDDGYLVIGKAKLTFRRRTK